jgi:chromosome segregation ATPase
MAKETLVPPPVGPPAVLPDWTNNRLIVGFISALLSATFTLAVSYWVFSTRLRDLEYNLKTKVENTDLQNLRTEVLRLTDKTAKLDDLRIAHEKTDADVTALAQKATDHISDITLLKNKVNQLEVDSARHSLAINDAIPRINALQAKSTGLEVDAARSAQAINDAYPRIATLEADAKATCANLAGLREQVARLEGAKASKP